MNPHSGIRLNAATAQNGIFRLLLAAATTGESGFGGGASAGADAPARRAGPLAIGAAGAAAAAGAGVPSEAASEEVDDSPPSALPPVSCARRSRERLRRCSGISVTAGRIDAAARRVESRAVGYESRTYAQPRTTARLGATLKKALITDRIGPPSELAVPLSGTARVRAVVHEPARPGDGGWRTDIVRPATTKGSRAK
jgi:hypothetical protein